MNKIKWKIDSIMNMLSGKVSWIKLQDTTGLELCFTDLQSTDVATVGHKVMVDGKPMNWILMLMVGLIKLKKN
jgi:hypothetical protein